MVVAEETTLMGQVVLEDMVAPIRAAVIRTLMGDLEERLGVTAQPRALAVATMSMAAGLQEVEASPVGMTPMARYG